MRNRVRSTPPVFALLLLLAFIPSNGRSQNKNQNALASAMLSQPQNKVVYVCACLKTKSCSCMTEAKMEGPCACGTEGGPPMKAVSPDSDWAKQNRNELAK
jgi:hypothetical protein